jgi:hypothetical protein
VEATSRGRGTHPLGTLPVLWRRWTGVVARYAGCEPGRLRIGPAEYDTLHRELLQACQALAENADAERLAWLGSLEQLIRPWMGLGSLEHADRELLADVLSRCRIIDRELSVRDWLAPLRRHRWLAVLVLGCLIVPPVLVAVVYWADVPIVDTLRPVWRWVRVTLRDTGGLGFWFAISGLVVFALCAVWGLAGPSRR